MTRHPPKDNPAAASAIASPQVSSLCIQSGVPPTFVREHLVFDSSTTVHHKAIALIIRKLRRNWFDAYRCGKCEWSLHSDGATPVGLLCARTIDNGRLPARGQLLDDSCILSRVWVPRRRLPLIPTKPFLNPHRQGTELGNGFLDWGRGTLKNEASMFHLRSVASLAIEEQVVDQQAYDRPVLGSSDCGDLYCLIRDESLLCAQLEPESSGTPWRAKEIIRIEQRLIHAAKVRNVPKVGYRLSKRELFTAQFR